MSYRNCDDCRGWGSPIPFRAEYGVKLGRARHADRARLAASRGRGAVWSDQSVGAGHHTDGLMAGGTTWQSPWCSQRRMPGRPLARRRARASSTPLPVTHVMRAGRRPCPRARPEGQAPCRCSACR